MRLKTWVNKNMIRSLTLETLGSEFTLITVYSFIVRFQVPPSRLNLNSYDI